MDVGTLVEKNVKLQNKFRVHMPVCVPVCPSAPDVL